MSETSEGVAGVTGPLSTMTCFWGEAGMGEAGEAGGMGESGMERAGEGGAGEPGLLLRDNVLVLF